VNPGFYEGKLCAAQYWIRTELPRIGALATLCRDGEDSYFRVKADWL
jgi:butyryl-CoA dehydrogenase